MQSTAHGGGQGHATPGPCGSHHRSPPRCLQELNMIKVSPQRLREPQHEGSAEPYRLCCSRGGAAPQGCPPFPLAGSHQMLCVHSSVMLQKPVPLTPSLGRACVQAVVVFFFSNMQFYSCCNFPRQRGQWSRGMEGEIFFPLVN